MPEMCVGTVKWFNEKKGYGFLVAARFERDVFVHYSQIQQGGFRTLVEGEEVRFEVDDTSRGPQARNVTRLSIGG